MIKILNYVSNLFIVRPLCYQLFRDYDFWFLRRMGVRLVHNNIQTYD